MTELAQGKRLVDQDVETMFEDADKRIKLLIRPGEMKARLEHFRQEAESKLYPPAIPEPLVKIRRNLHPPFLGESLEYMREFHKSHSANDLYGLPKACQDTIDLILTCPDAERIIQKTSDPGLKARFQHIREARVLGFEVDPYTDINAADLPFSLEDLHIYDVTLKYFRRFLSSALRPMKSHVLPVWMLISTLGMLGYTTRSRFRS